MKIRTWLWKNMLVSTFLLSSFVSMTAELCPQKWSRLLLSLVSSFHNNLYLVTGEYLDIHSSLTHSSKWTKSVWGQSGPDISFTSNADGWNVKCANPNHVHQLRWDARLYHLNLPLIKLYVMRTIRQSTHTRITLGGGLPSIAFVFHCFTSSLFTVQKTVNSIFSNYLISRYFLPR